MIWSLPLLIEYSTMITCQHRCLTAKKVTLKIANAKYTMESTLTEIPILDAIAKSISGYPIPVAGLCDLEWT